jgi:hypothetical protein
MRTLLIALSLLIATPAMAKDITITLTDAEQKVFLTLLDTALKQGGLGQLQAVSQFVAKIQMAMKAAEESAKPETKKP